MVQWPALAQGRAADRYPRQMLLTLALLVLGSFRDSDSELVARVDALAQKRDVAAIQALLPESETLGRQHLSVLRTGGAYGTGRYGWRAVPLNDPDGARYLVLTTRITSEDVGELIFEVRGGKIARYLAEANPGGWRILNHKIRLQFDLPKKVAKLEDQINVQIPGRTDRPLMLRFSPNYKVSAATSKGRPFRFVQAGGTVLLPDAANSTGQLNVTLKYEGVVDQPGYAGGIVADEASLVNDYWYPMVGRLPSAHSLEVRGPKDWVAVGQGVRVAESVVGEEKVTRFQMDLPVVYFSFALGKYRTASRKIGENTYNVWSTRLEPEEMDDQIQFMDGVHRFYEDAFGLDHFQGFGALVSKPYGGGALEAYSFATYGEGWLPDEDAHEPAHTWWGGQINNTYLSSFWNESFAVFSEGLFARNAPIGNKAERKLAFVQTPNIDPGWEQVAVADGSAFAGPIASSLGYGKGGLILQMLESWVGPEAMLRALRAWLNLHPHMQAGDWDGFEQRFTEVNGIVWKRFFDDWVRRPGFLKLSASDVKYASGAVTGRLKQEGKPYFGYAEVLLQFSDGKRQLAKVDLLQPTFRIPTSRKPTLVSVDPFLRLVRQIAPSELPDSFDRLTSSFRVYRDPKQPEELPTLDRKSLGKLPADLDKVLLVGRPSTLPALGTLCAKVGFKVAGDWLEYRGTRIDLRKNGAVAIVPLGGGKQCAIALGAPRYAPRTGRAKVALVDELGRFLRGHTEPKTKGALTFRL